MKSDFYTAIAQIAAERGIPREAVLSSVQQALVTVYKKMAGSAENVEVVWRFRRLTRAMVHACNSMIILIREIFDLRKTPSVSQDPSRKRSTPQAPCIPTSNLRFTYVATY